MNGEIIQDDESMLARRLEWEKRQAALKKEEERKMEGGNTIEDAQRTINRLRNIYRIINGTTAITLVGLIVTFLVMNAQLIFGNFFKVRLVPSLTLIEIFILGLLDLIVFIVLLIAVSIIYFVVNPCELSAMFGTWWADMLGVVCQGAQNAVGAIK